jgi:hypothetical protein
MGTCWMCCQGKNGPAAFRKHAPGLTETRSGLLIGRSAGSTIGQVAVEQNPFGLGSDAFGQLDPDVQAYAFTFG